MSAKLVTAKIQEVFKYAQIEEKGIDVDGEQLSNPRYVDNVAQSLKNIEHQVNVEKALT